MISVILMDSQTNPILTIKQVKNIFIVERAYDCSTGQFSMTVKDRKLNNSLHKTRFLQIFGGGMSNLLVVSKVTTDNTQSFPKITMDVNGIEYLLNQRNMNDQEIMWDQKNPMEIASDLVNRIQNGSDISKFPQLYDETLFKGSMELEESWLMNGGNVWEYIVNNMSSYKFCCDAEVKSYGKAQLIFRAPEDKKNIIISDISRQTKLQYINTDYSDICTAVTVGGEGEGIRRKYATEDSEGTTGADRFEAFIDASSLASNEGYISNDKYMEMLQTEAKSHIKLLEQETDYIVPTSIFKNIKTGDTVYTSSTAVDNGVIKPKIINEMKTEVVDGVTYRSITFI